MKRAENDKRPRFYVPVNEQCETAVRSDLRMTAAYPSINPAYLPVVTGQRKDAQWQAH